MQGNPMQHRAMKKHDLGENEICTYHGLVHDCRTDCHFRFYYGYHSRYGAEPPFWLVLLKWHIPVLF